MGQISAFLKKKNIVISAKRYGVDALGAMAQGLFCSLLIGTILDTLGKQLGLAFLVEVGGYCSAMSGAAMAVVASMTITRMLVNRRFIPFLLLPRMRLMISR